MAPRNIYHSIRPIIPGILQSIKGIPFFFFPWSTLLLNSQFRWPCLRTTRKRRQERRRSTAAERRDDRVWTWSSSFHSYQVRKAWSEKESIWRHQVYCLNGLFFPFKCFCLLSNRRYGWLPSFLLGRNSPTQGYALGYMGRTNKIQNKNAHHGACNRFFCFFDIILVCWFSGICLDSNEMSL